MIKGCGFRSKREMEFIFKVFYIYGFVMKKPLTYIIFTRVIGKSSGRNV